MSWSGIESRINATVMSQFGEVVTVTQGITTTSTLAVIKKATDPMLIDGAVTFSEHRYVGYVRIAALTTEPAIGNTLTTASGAVYTIDQPPFHEDGLYRLILRKTS